MNDAVLDIRGLVKEYPGIPPTRALRGVDLRIGRGEAVAILGPSGSGKSTLLHMMGTLDRATAGTITVAGRVTDDLDDADLSAVRAHHLGFVFQQFHLLPGYSALDNVADGVLYRGLELGERRALARRALLQVGLGDRIDHTAETLSGGERQRVAVARAIVGSPDIVLADEPTGNLDSTTSAAVIDLFMALHAAGMTVVVITHDREVAARFPRHVEIRDGLIVSDRRAA